MDAGKLLDLTEAVGDPWPERKWVIEQTIQCYLAIRKIMEFELFFKS